MAMSVGQVEVSNPPFSSHKLFQTVLSGFTCSYYCQCTMTLTLTLSTQEPIRTAFQQVVLFGQVPMVTLFQQISATVALFQQVVVSPS